ncbi:unnamed protein product [Cuscuta epithymum]|uniref:PUM-HD domain-containing protein n=1 Tax=Cuscuta epithymum TaxID=186058 RepID=A0AAV0F3P4_9ASTE|nr:unnamed protein product [Cuscuta epithymum]
MATENPMRIVESRRAGQWGSPSKDELGLLLKGHHKVPHRSGSAPPSMEGSFTAFGNLIHREAGGWCSGPTNLLETTLLNYQSEEQIRAEPSYFAYYSSNVNLNPRLPPPIISRENRHHLAQHVGSTTSGGGDDRLLSFPRGSLSTHIEEPDDDSSTHNALDEFAENRTAQLAEQKLDALTSQHKSLVDLIQDDFPRTPSPLYGQSCVAVEEQAQCNVQSLGLENLSLEVSQKPAMVEPTKGDASSSYQNETVTHLHSQLHTPHQVTGLQVQIPSHGMDKGHIHTRLPEASGLTPLYATAAAYMASGSSLYANLNTSGLYSPQYSMAGYAMGSPFLPPYYSHNNSLPIQFDAIPGQNVSSQTRDVPQLGHHGLMMHPSLPDHFGPFQMQYFQQHPVEDAFSDPSIPSYFSDQKFLPHHHSASMGTANQRKMGSTNNSYYGSPTAVGYVPQFPVSPLGSPGSPIGGVYPFGRRNEIRLSQGSSKNVGVYPGWQVQRDNLNEPKKHSFLDELKANNARKIDISDIAGRIAEFSVDQHGSRFIQQKLENCSDEEKGSVFAEVLPHASKLMTDVFGNYVIQKFFEHGSYDQRKELAFQLKGKMLSLSLQMYGCRVIQKALEVIDIDQKRELVHELDGHVMTCVRDQNGNHVIQKCIECVPTESIEFIISAFQGQVASLSTHPYGCRVIQRVLEHCSGDPQSQCIVDEILELAYVLAQDQYGNYVTQHVLERGKAHERKHIISKLSGKVVQLSQHKYASNVVEKCLVHGDAADQELLIGEILAQSDGNDSLLTMMKDQFANYVVQKILEISNDKQCQVLLSRIRVHLPALRKYTYGKHIVARFEQLSGEEE